MHDVKPLIFRSGTEFPSIKRAETETLQVNLGYLCNLSCTHCHVNAGPKRTEQMSEATIELVLDYIRSSKVSTLDLTGGAPEMNRCFRYLVMAARELNVSVIDRCNLTILFEPGQEGLGEFLAQQGVHIVASLPCYLEENVAKQRGKGVFGQSIEAIQLLNRLGYGEPDTGLTLDLVYNPTGPFLPPPQQSLEAEYKRVLGDEYGIKFNHLLTLTNMPIARFGSGLVSKGEFDGYMGLLKDNFSASNLSGLMCRSTLSIDWQGYVYDCDFNQMLQYPLTKTVKHHEQKNQADAKTHLSELIGCDLKGQSGAVADHCFGCTAGQGSSCGGALA